MTGGQLHCSVNRGATDQGLAARGPFTSPTGRLKPGNTDRITDTASANTGADSDNFPCRFMPQGSREGPRKLTPGLMHISKTQSTGMNLDKDLIGTGLRCRNLFDLPLTIYLGDNGGFHASSFSRMRINNCLMVYFFGRQRTMRVNLKTSLDLW